MKNSLAKRSLLTAFAIVLGFLALLSAIGRASHAGELGQQSTQSSSQAGAAASTGLGGVGPQVHGVPGDPLRDPREVHLRHVRQLTFGGQNAEAYFSYDNRRLIFQSTRPPYECDQMFVMNTSGSDVHLVSTGKGRTTCGFFYPDGKHILYASTHAADPACPPRPDYSKGYVWGVYSTYRIYYATAEGKILKDLTPWKGYNAEATMSKDGSKIVFTSSRDGDLDIYTMNADGTEVKQLTHELGYDGGPTFSPDGQWIVYRARHPQNADEIARYKSLLAADLVSPLEMDLYVMRADGSDQQQITHLPGASFAPAFYPDSGHIIFASNYQKPTSSEFELYTVDRNGSGLEPLTFTGGFNAFPMFSWDGKKLVFISNRNAKAPHEINVFIADWVN